MKTLRRPSTWLACACFAACFGAPPPPAPTPLPPPPPPVVPTPAPAPKPSAARQTVRLENGLTAVVTTVAAGRPATLQFGIAAGAAFMAPGSAELAAHVVVESADPSQGRVSLRQAIAGLGGTVQVVVGPLTSWIDVRVAGGRWREALTALHEALRAPSWSRHQIDRIRSEFVAARAAELRLDPARGMARLLMLGESSSASYVLGLLDRDPSEVAGFLARVYQPERAVLAMEVPADAATAAADLARTGSIGLGGWTPAAPPPGPVLLLDRKFESGLWWAPGRTDAEKATACRVALVAMLPDVARPTAAEELLWAACYSLDGAGGRLEQLQRQRGLGHVHWQGEIVQTPDAAALVLTASVRATEVGDLWQVAQQARQSLGDLPPNDSELAIAKARVPLTTRLLVADDGGRLRLMTRLLLAGTELGAVDRRLAFLEAAPAIDPRGASSAFLALPFAMVVVGGDLPAALPGVRRYEVLPAGQGEAGAEAVVGDVATTPARPQPWLTNAVDAVGGADVLRRLEGWRSTATVTHEAAPPMDEVVTWRLTGELLRTRTLLGQKIETTVAAKEWFERVGDNARSLDAAEAALLRRELQRHPLSLLAAHARGELTFRTVAQREAGDRAVVVLEALGDRFDRLRLHLDSQSHLVRVVETWETMPGGSVVHVQDTWQDYRTIAGLRVPHRRLTSQDDGQNRLEAILTQWTPMLRAE